MLKVGNLLSRVAQLPHANEQGKIGGALYSTFIGITRQEVFLVYRLDNEKVTQLDLNEEFRSPRKRKIKLR